MRTLFTQIDSCRVVIQTIIIKQFMKNFITLLALLLSCVYSNAQTAEQTIEWLNAKKTNINPYLSYYQSDKKGELNSVHFSTEEISFGYFEWIYDKDYPFTGSISWKDINDIHDEGLKIMIKAGLTSKGKNRYISLYMPDQDSRNKFIKALTHMASLKGAKLIDKDLF